MNYSQSLNYLNSFINLERFSRFPEQRELNLKRMKALFKLFSRPERSFYPVLIAGTKGKGSTGFFLESVLESQGLSAGFYSSPHIQDVRERIRVRGKIISKRVWAEQLTVIEKKLGKRKALKGLGEFTYFEVMTLLAALVFQKARLKVGIFEIGLGGRLDASNAIDAEISLITPIHFDHEMFLGNTLKKIAREKAAIIKKGKMAVISSQQPEALKEIKKAVKRQKAKAFYPKSLDNLKLGLAGKHQNQNAATALKAAKLICKDFRTVFSEVSAEKGLQKNNWPGRLEQLKGSFPVILDVAHNPASSKALAESLKKLYPGKSPILIFGASKDKKTGQMLEAFKGLAKEIILTEANQPRAKSVRDLLFESREYFEEIYAAQNSQEALKIASLRAKKDQPTVATGSFYLVGEIRKELTENYA